MRRVGQRLAASLVADNLADQGDGGVVYDVDEGGDVACLGGAEEAVKGRAAVFGDRQA